MHSTFANLLSLVLPSGAIAGARLLLDGVNGRIAAFDAFDDRVIVIDPNRIRAQTSDSGAFVELDPADAALVLNDSQATNDARVTATTVAGARRLSVQAPYDALAERASLVLDSDSPSTARIEADQLELSADVAFQVTDTTDASGFVTFNHGASITPKVVAVFHESPLSGPAAFLAGVDTIGATTARARFLAVSAGSVVSHASAAVTFRVVTIV